MTVSDRVALSLRALGPAGETSLPELVAGLAAETAACHDAGRITGVDPEAIRQWAHIELVSTGLHVLRLGDHEEARLFLTVADLSC
ncbi:hypothetical protein M1L60_03400 [Actinoplanes sp. TRM 88003]|uniref:Uncharacterized protein n=1 Tax=Paractinoplanes aksuensis TaxID=2939490 RepID=A0ABT1DFM0_9ACTN|nr:hypothetical protein [Actinoplanes aksuensis]MCO8269634.1 hypothetical protein [Actinoplanes aksuensis]